MEINSKHRIVVLGVDGVGKTTFAKALAKYLNGIYHKDECYKKYFFGNPHYTWHATYALMQLITNVPHTLVFDRWFYDEYVYGYVMRREFDKKHFNRLVDICREQNFKIVYMFRDNPRPDELIDSHMIQPLKNAYSDFFDKYHDLDMVYLNGDNTTENHLAIVLDKFNLR